MLQRRENDAFRHWNLAAALAMGLVAAIGSMTPFEPRHVPVSVAIEYLRQAIQYGTFFSPVDWLSNFVLFLPLAFFALGSFEGLNTNGQWAVGMLAVIFAILCLYSVLLELCQIWMSGRVPSPHDVAAQCLGAVSGILVWLWRGPTIANLIWSSLKPLTGAGLRGIVTIGCLVGVVAYSLHPLDLTLHPTELWRKWKAGHIVLLPLTDAVATSDLAASCVRQALIYLPIGLFWPSFRSKAGNPSRVLAVCLMLVPVAVEGLQVFAYSRWASATHALAGLLGILIGRLVSKTIGWTMSRWGVSSFS